MTHLTHHLDEDSCADKVGGFKRSGFHRDGNFSHNQWPDGNKDVGAAPTRHMNLTNTGHGEVYDVGENELEGLTFCNNDCDLTKRKSQSVQIMFNRT